MDKRRRLFLIDGSALAYRSYYGISSREPLTTSKGEDTSAPFGFTSTMIKLLKDEDPDYIAVVFDTPSPTFRHKMYKEYKATRQKMPDKMSASLPRIYQILEGMRITVLELEGFEADDIMGTLAKRAQKEDIEVILVTGDKDFMQLVSDNVKIMNLPKGGKETELMDKQAVLEKMGVGPDRVVDILSLVGDSSDNVPGISGIGPKTALELIVEYGSLEEVLKNADAISKRKVRENINQQRDDATRAKELVTIKTDVPIEYKIEDLKRNQFNFEALREVFKELEFNRFLVEIAKEKRAEDADYRTVDENGLKRLLKKIEKEGVFCIDVETTGVDAMQAEILGISVSLKQKEGFYIPLGHEEGGNVDIELTLEKIKPILQDPKIEKLGQNVKYDITVLKRYGIDSVGFTFDTMIAAYLIDPSSRQHSLDSLSMRYLGYKMTPISDLIGTGKKQISFAKVPVDTARDYSSEDADITLRLKSVLSNELREKGLEELFFKIEMPLVDVLVDMEMSGVSVDIDFLKEMSEELKTGLENLEERIYEEADEKFNINSTQQLSYILFEKLKLPPGKKTKTGYSTDVDVLEELAEEHRLPKLLLDYRQLSKLKSTYVDALPKLVNLETRRTHTSFNQTVAATGRLSSSDPNLQNIPIRTDIGRRIRQAFITEDRSWVLMSADYSQIELRVMAHFSGDDALIEAFKRDEDVHQKTASLMFNVFPELVTPEMRAQAKTVNFATIYGQTAFGLSRQLGIGQKEAQDFIDSYFAVYPGVKRYFDQTIQDAKEKGYVTTLLGRRRYLPEIKSSNARIREVSERTAINTPIQGTAADIIKIAMINIHRRIKKENLRTKMILQVHDELVFETPKDEVEEAKRLIVEDMEGAYELSVPIKVEVGVGDSWLEAH